MPLPFALLMLAIAALWFGAREGAPPWRRHLWLLLFGAALGAAGMAGIVRPLGLLWIGSLAAASNWFARESTRPGQRAAAALAILALAAGLMTHRLPGFHNPCVLDGVRFSADAVPYRLFLNFDKTVIAVFLLGFCHARIGTAAEWWRLVRRTAPIAAVLIAGLMLASLAIGYVRFDPKLPEATWLWLGVNLGFTCCAEEALFRGFIQAQLPRLWPRARHGATLALVIAAILFGVAHAAGGPAYVALATLAGLGYGWVYQRTGRIEASILTHFALNTVHFLFFTYPALERLP